MSYKVGIVGGTGVVGHELIHLFNKRNFPIAELRVMASARSAGKTITVDGDDYTIIEATADAFKGLDFAIFSAGAGTSRELGPKAVENGCVVIDNSSAFRQDDEVPLVVPEINPDAVKKHKGILANPNCSTAIALMGLFPLHKAFGLKRFFASTYQAVSGSGVEALEELKQQAKSWAEEKDLDVSAYPHQILFNLLPHVDVFLDSGYTKEEMKMLHESVKIMDLPELKVSTTCVRVPVFRAHSIAVNAEFEKPVDLEQARKAVADFEGSELFDEPDANKYPMPIDYSEKEKCGVGRLRVDAALDNGLSLWVVGDQLWKGAALNAVQIAELMHKEGLFALESSPG